MYSLLYFMINDYLFYDDHAMHSMVILLCAVWFSTIFGMIWRYDPLGIYAMMINYKQLWCVAMNVTL